MLAFRIASQCGCAVFGHVLHSYLLYATCLHACMTISMHLQETDRSKYMAWSKTAAASLAELMKQELVAQEKNEKGISLQTWAAMAEGKPKPVTHPFSVKEYMQVALGWEFVDKRA